MYFNPISLNPVYQITLFRAGFFASSPEDDIVDEDIFNMYDGWDEITMTDPVQYLKVTEYYPI